MTSIALRSSPGLRPIERVASWYFKNVYGRREGPGVTPFYCDAAKVGAFAVSRTRLASGSEGALFRLFVSLSMYQALRDVVVMRHQRSLSRGAVKLLASPAHLRRAIANHRCVAFKKEESFEQECDVWKKDGLIDCGRCPGEACPVKDGTRLFKRMGDIGKLPSSAWLRLWKQGGIRGLLEEVRDATDSPTDRAELLVERFATVHRVGIKLATLFVSALSTPELAPGLTPWHPEIDGHSLVVVDTNVAHAIDEVRGAGGAKTYAARANWLKEEALTINLGQFRCDVPSYSPRLLQQALYSYCSASNRREAGDQCATSSQTCDRCVEDLCPFAGRRGLGRTPT